MRDAARLRPLAPHERLEEIARRCISTLAKQLGDRYTPARTSLAAYRIYDPSGEQAAALQRVTGFVDRMETMLRETRGLVLYGSVGTGKDYLLAAALYHVAGAGIPAGFVSGEDLYLRVRDSFDTGEREDAILHRLQEPVVLGISDPVGTRGELSDWNARVLARVLDRRYRAMRPTWLTLNATNEDDARKKLTPLIWDRFQDAAEIVPCFWQSFRSLRPTASGARPITGKITA